MLPYFILLFIVVIFAAFAQKYRRTPKTSHFFSFLVFIALVSFAGLRDFKVGTDTGNYVGSFLNVNTEKNILEINTTREIGYLFLEKLARIITNEYWFLLSLIALISIYFYYKTILKLSINYTISFFVFISLCVYLFVFNGARQGIAAAIYSFAILYMIKGNFKKYIFWVGVAFLFHRTVLITLPMYFILRLKFSFKNLMIIGISSIVLILFTFQILSFFPESFVYRYTQYLDRGASGGMLLTIFYITTTIILLILHQFISPKNRKYYDIYLNMIIFNALIYIIVFFSGLDINLMRLSQYFVLSFVLIWPIVFKDIPKGIVLPIFLYFIFSQLFFYYIYLSKMSNLVPYIFNQNIFVN